MTISELSAKIHVHQWRWTKKVIWKLWRGCNTWVSSIMVVSYYSIQRNPRTLTSVRENLYKFWLNVCGNQTSIAASWFLPFWIQLSFFLKSQIAEEEISKRYWALYPRQTLLVVSLCFQKNGHKLTSKIRITYLIIFFFLIHSKWHHCLRRENAFAASALTGVCGRTRNNTCSLTSGFGSPIRFWVLSRGWVMRVSLVQQTKENKS